MWAVTYPIGVRGYQPATDPGDAPANAGGYVSFTVHEEALGMLWLMAFAGVVFAWACTAAAVAAATFGRRVLEMLDSRRP